jgi:hypothetical protein
MRITHVDLVNLSNDPAVMASTMGLPLGLSTVLSSKGYWVDFSDNTLGGVFTDDPDERDLDLLWGDVHTVHTLLSLNLGDIPSYLNSPLKIYDLIPDSNAYKPDLRLAEEFYRMFAHGLLTSRLQLGT